MDHTREYFDQVADKWDDMRKTFFGEGVRRAAVQAAGVRPGFVVADVGTGTGFIAEAALDAGATVIGIDNSEGMLAQVSERFRGRLFESRRGDTDGLPLKNGEADAVLANMVLHHAPDPAAAIKEMSRALRPGGTLVITDADTHTHEWLRIEMHDRWLGFDRDTVAGWFRAAGLDEVAVVDTHEICSPTSNAGTKAAITIFLAKGRKPTQGPA
jgi:ubiquinone/menaquinone biosynthesis C-methylase UbiE